MTIRRCAVAATIAVVALAGTACSSSTAMSNPTRIIASASASDNTSIAVLPTKVSPCLVNAGIVKNLVQGDIDKPFTTTTQSIRLQGRQCNYGTDHAIPDADIQVYTSTPGIHDVYHVMTARQNNIGSHQVALTSTELNDLKFSGVTDAIWYFDDQSKPVDPTALAMDANGVMIIVVVVSTPAHVSAYYRSHFLLAGEVAASSLMKSQMMSRPSSPSSK